MFKLSYTVFRGIYERFLFFNFLICEDSEIIRSFGYLSYSFLAWYRTTDSLAEFKFVLGIIKQSCLLTLCRKHNRSKNWAYQVYTSKLSVDKRINLSGFLFPDNKFVKNLKYKVLSRDFLNVFLNEDWFLGLN